MGSVIKELKGNIWELSESLIREAIDGEHVFEYPKRANMQEENKKLTRKEGD